MDIKKKKFYIILFLLPTMIVFVMIFAWPILSIFINSMFQWKIGLQKGFIGFENFHNLLKDDVFILSTMNTIIWCVLQGTVHVVIGVIAALIISKKTFFNNFFRTVYMIPNIISTAALGILYINLFSPSIGLVNGIIRGFGFENFSINWFQSFDTAFLTVTMIWLPFAATIMLLVSAEIGAIDKSIIESARIDGATNIQTNLYVIIPQLRNIIGTCAIIGATGMLKNFDIIYVTTNGGPFNKTVSLPLYIYKVLMLENNFGYSSAASVILVCLGVLIIGLIRGIMRFGEIDEVRK